ncbi:MAG: N-acetylmuramoyl-L-alanine amidase [Deltaproteobacteria bacterium]|nr:N-acetylmuramoyl-L-alanine amidase [Deltaproteobacteria bacterium]
MFFLFLLPAVVPQRCGADSGAQEFENIKARYLKLRNTDTEVAKVSEWSAVATDFEHFAEEHSTSKHAPTALLDASIAYEKIFEVNGDTQKLNRSVAVLESLLKRYPANSLADDALLREGDLYAQRFSDSEKAQAIYQRVIRLYPKGDAVEIARARIGGVSTRASRDVYEPYNENDSSKPLIMIDPGHGGEDLGAEGASGLLEKDVALDISRELAALIKASGVARARLTRKGDEFVPLAERTAKANEAEAALFISIHSNASPKSKLSGIQTFYLDTDGDESSRLLAERENGTEGGQGAQGDLQFMLSDLVQTAKLDDSIRLGATLQKSILTATRGRWKDVKDLGTRKAPFYVLVGAHMPCVLVEVLFIDHPEDGKKLSDRDFRRAVAAGMFEGILKYLNVKGS